MYGRRPSVVCANKKRLFFFYKLDPFGQICKTVARSTIKQQQHPTTGKNRYFNSTRVNTAHTHTHSLMMRHKLKWISRPHHCVCIIFSWNSEMKLGWFDCWGYMKCLRLEMSSPPPVEWQRKCHTHTTHDTRTRHTDDKKRTENELADWAGLG